MGIAHAKVPILYYWKGMMIEMKMDYIRKIVTPETLAPYYLPETILGYCAQCKDYGLFWGCPPHEIDGMTLVCGFKSVEIVGLKVTLEQEIESFEGIYQSARRTLGGYLDRLASNVERRQVLIAGNCYGCEVCSRKTQQPCKKPEALRFSLESLGFDVSGISENVLNLPILWPEDGSTPDYLVCVGAVLQGAIVE